MTKEECIDKYVGAYWRKLSPQTAEGMKEALAEYAKQQATAFMNWTLSNDCHWQCTDEDQWTIATESITTEQLYELFIQQNENK